MSTIPLDQNCKLAAILECDEYCFACANEFALDIAWAGLWERETNDVPGIQLSTETTIDATGRV
jgi:hypothetical protein